MKERQELNRLATHFGLSKEDLKERFPSCDLRHKRDCQKVIEYFNKVLKTSQNWKKTGKVDLDWA